MAELIRCDQCKKEAPGDFPPLGWRRLELQSTMVRAGEPLGPWHFCSWACLREYAARQAPTI